MPDKSLKEILREKLLSKIDLSSPNLGSLRAKEMLKRLDSGDFDEKISEYPSLIKRDNLSLNDIEQNILGNIEKGKPSNILFHEEDSTNATNFYNAISKYYRDPQIAGLMAVAHEETASGGNPLVVGKVWDYNKIQKGKKGGVANRYVYSFEEGPNPYLDRDPDQRPTSYWYQHWKENKGKGYENPYLSQTKFYTDLYLNKKDLQEYKKIFDNPNSTIEQITAALHAAQKSKSENLSSVIEKAKFLYDNFPKNSLPKKEDKREVIEPKSKKLNFDFMRPILGGNRDIIPYRNNEEYKYGGNLKYKENEVYDLNESEINKLLKDGYELEYL